MSSKFSPQLLGANVRYWRLARGLSQSQLARRLGHRNARGWLARIELGYFRQMNPILLYEYASALEIPFSFLFRADAGDPYLLEAFQQARKLSPHNLKVLFEVMTEMAHLRRRGGAKIAA